MRTKQFTFGVLTVLTTLIVACGPQGVVIPGTGGTSIPGVPTGDLANTQWHLVSINEAGSEIPVIEGTQVTLRFEPVGVLVGSSGCNTFGGEYRVNENSLTIGQIVSTEMACTTEGLMEQEQRYYQALQSSGEYELNGDQLTITYGGGQGTLNFERDRVEIPATPIRPAPLAGTGPWTLVSFGELGAATPVIEGSTITLEFGEDGQAVGSGGCNSYGAQYQADEDTISFSQIVSTLMACEQAGIGDQEQRYFGALDSAERYELGADSLTIQYDGGNGVLDFISSPAAQELCTLAPLDSDPDWKLCFNREFGFEIQIPQEADIVDQSEAEARINLPFEAGTNLTEKYLQVTATTHEPTCASPLAEGYAPGTVPSENVAFDGFEFLKQSGEEGAAGSVYKWVAYSITQGDVCVSLGFVLRSHAPELEATPPPVYDEEAESEVFEEIVSSFRWLRSSGQIGSGPERIRFDAGATSATVTGSLEASGSAEYVLYALQGQTMSVDLSFSEGEAILVVWGEDGNVLLTDHAEVSHFNGVLPTTQDYHILLKGNPDSHTVYTMEVSIPPANP